MVFLMRREQYRKSLKLAVPVMLAQAGIMAVQLFDNAMVGRLGALPLASVAFGGTVFFLIFILVTGITMALTPLVGEQYVQGHYRISTAFFQNSLLMFTVTGIVAAAVQFATIPLMYHMNQPVEVVDMAIPYYKYLVWSIIPYMIFCSFKQFLEGVGNTTANMVIIITCNIINIFFNWLLIYGKWGFPMMGAAGAGLATMISRVCMPVFAGLYFFVIPRYKRYFKYFRISVFSWSKVAELLKVGLPISLQMFMEGAAFALTTIMMGWIGTVELAANQIAMTIANFAFMIVLGISASATIRVSHEYGRGDVKEFKRAADTSYRLTLIWNTATAILIVVFREYIARIFTGDPEVVRVASYLLIFVAAFQFSDGLQSVSIGILRGIQDVKSVMMIAFFAYIVINLPASYLCAFVLDWGPGGLWIGFIFGLSIAAVLLIARFRRKYTGLKKKQDALPISVKLT